MNDDLIQRVKRRCYVTDNDDIITNRIIDIIEDSIPIVRRIIGITDEDYNFSKEGEERRLFLNYCYYAWNDCTESFKNNYLDDIMSVRSKYEVKQYAESQKTN